MTTQPTQKKYTEADVSDEVVDLIFDDCDDNRPEKIIAESWNHCPDLKLYKSASKALSNAYTDDEEYIKEIALKVGIPREIIDGNTEHVSPPCLMELVDLIVEKLTVGRDLLNKEAERFTRLNDSLQEQLNAKPDRLTWRWEGFCIYVGSFRVARIDPYGNEFMIYNLIKHEYNDYLKHIEPESRQACEKIAEEFIEALTQK